MDSHDPERANDKDHIDNDLNPDVKATAILNHNQSDSRGPRREPELSYLHGVVCCCLDRDRSISDTIYKFFKFSGSSHYTNIDCQNLELENKYYKTTIHLFDYDDLSEQQKTNKKILNDCHAIIIFADGSKLTTEQLDSKLEEYSSVGGEPRILLVDRITSNCEAHKTLLDWSIKNGFEYMNADEDQNLEKEIIDSLSAYRWPNRSDTVRPAPSTTSNGCLTNQSNGEKSKPSELNEQTLKQLMDFDNLLGKISAYRDNPELRGNPNDKKIEEIAEILSNLVGDDVEGFLSDSDSP